MYQRCIQWNSTRDLSIQTKYDTLYEEGCKGPTNIMADYERLEINSFQEGYNTCLLRKYPWSNAIDVNIELAGIEDGFHLLDAGCGTGISAIHFCKKLPHLTIDCIVNSKKCFNLTTENVVKANLTNRIHVYFMDFDHFEEPILSKRYDRIVMLQTIGYSTNRKELFKNLRNLLKPEGKLFISTVTISECPKDTTATQIIHLWKYNFSTLGCILSDAKDYTHVKYITYDPTFYSYFFFNPIDFYYIGSFNHANHQNLLDRYFYLPRFITVQLVLFTR